MLGIQFGIGAESLGLQVGGTFTGERLIADHKLAFPRYWDWTETVKARVSLHRQTLHTPLGWRIRCGAGTNSNLCSVVNWPVQATGSDIMRVAAVSMVEHGLEVVAPIHDAFVILCRDEELERSTALARRLMEESSEAVLGVPCAVDVRTFGSGGRYRDEKGERMFSLIIETLKDICPEVTV
jgi:DNA polymerase I-like protein with 3'-5' exonuclease and polymerase domains